jgi:hypothetical protein
MCECGRGKQTIVTSSWLAQVLISSGERWEGNSNRRERMDLKKVLNMHLKAKKSSTPHEILTRLELCGAVSENEMH